MSLYLHGLGHFHSEVEIDNRFLEDLDIGTNDAWIMERVGIRTRRTLLPLDYIRETRNADPRMASEAMLYSNAETGRRAALMAKVCTVRPSWRKCPWRGMVTLSWPAGLDSRVLPRICARPGSLVEMTAADVPSPQSTAEDRSL